jgi:hypothetical protein
MEVGTTKRRFLMKKQIILVAIAVIGGCLIMSGQAIAGPKAQPCNPNPCAIAGTYYSVDDDFKNTMWMEDSISGFHGAIDNGLSAVGNAYILKDAVLTEVVPDGLSPDGTPQYKTTYELGELRLNSKGPWLDCGLLVATDPTITNTSYRDSEGNLIFDLIIEGTFDNCECDFLVEVHFDANEMRYQEVVDEQGNLVHHKGRDYTATINIDCTLPGPGYFPPGY